MDSIKITFPLFNFTDVPFPRGVHKTLSKMHLFDDAVSFQFVAHCSVVPINKPFRKVFDSKMLFFPYKSSTTFVSQVSAK